MKYILIFMNTHSALHCEKVLMDENIDITILPTPSYINNSCGISIGICEKDIHAVNRLIENNKISIKFIYDICENCIVK